MAELATIARPYAEALYKAVPPAEASAAADQLSELAQVAGNPQLRQFADNPGALPQQVVDVITSVVRTPVGDAVRNLLLAVVDNGRISALPEISLQYHALVNARSGVSDATVYSAFPIDDAQLAEVVASLERRFGRKLNATVAIEPELIGGIRVVVGDEVLDTSVKARLEQMRVALTA